MNEEAGGGREGREGREGRTEERTYLEELPRHGAPGLHALHIS